MNFFEVEEKKESQAKHSSEEDIDRIPESEEEELK